MKELPVYKITIDDLDESGIEYVSLVESPAIQVKGLMFNKQEQFASLPPCHEYCVCYIDNDGNWQFGSTETSPCDYCQERKSIYEQTYNFNSTKYNFAFNEEKQIIAGPAIIPDLKIYRYDPDLGEYYVLFERPTIEKMVEKFNKVQKEYKINLEHSSTMVPAFIKGSWIIEDMENDKSRMYGFTDLPVGTWFIEVKVEDKKFWMEEVKGKNRNGFSIEGLMGIQLSAILNQEFQSYDDYPQSAKDNACKVLRWRDEHGEDEVDGMTRVGWIRANQLCNGEKISEETIARMAAFERHRENSKINPDFEGTPWKDRGYVAWLGWGGDEGIAWAQRKLEQIRQEMSNEKLSFAKVSFDVDGVLTTADGKDLLQKAIDNGDEVFVISARHNEDKIATMLKDFNIPRSHIFATGSNTEKVNKINELGIDKHYDDNPNVIKELGRIGIKLTINKKQSNMKKKLLFRDYTLKDGGMITIDGDMAIGSFVYYVKDEGTREQAPEGEYILEDGTTLFVDAEGYINEIRTAATTETTQANEGDAPMAMQVTPEEVMAVVSPVLDEMRMVIAELQSRVEMLEGKMNDSADAVMMPEDMKKKEFSDITSKINKIRSYIA